jgi:class 3 adenylate cyclase
VLFVDMVGFTELASALDPEDVGAVQSEYFATVSGVIHRYAGIVEKYIGDAVMAVFGVPRCDGYDAYRAVLAGLRLPDAVARVRLPDGRPVRVRVGIATGEALVDGYAADGGQRLVSGDVVNVAARLQTYAAVGTALVDPGTHRATRDVVGYHGLGPVRVAGRPEPLEVWHPMDEWAEREPLDEVPLVGRAAELATMAGHVAAALYAGSPALVLLVAPAGGGRSRLVRDLRRQPGIGPRDGIRWAATRCLPGGECDAMLDEVRRAARDGPDQPTVLVVEDVHWAGPPVIRQLREFATDVASRRAPVAIVVTSTTDLSGLPLGSGARVELAELAPAQTGQLLHRLLRRAGLPVGYARRLVPLVHGNPTYAQAYVRALAESGRRRVRPVAALPVPDVVRATVSARIDRLDRPERVALLTACAVGPVVSADVLAYLLHTTCDEAYRMLRRLAHAGLLAARPGTGFRYAFTDPAVRAVGYTWLPRRAREDLRRRTADWYATRQSAARSRIPLPHNGSALMSDERPVSIRSISRRPDTMDRWRRTAPHQVRSPTSTAGLRNSPR